MPPRKAAAGDAAEVSDRVNEILAVCPVADKHGEWTALRLLVEWMDPAYKDTPWDVSLSSFGTDAASCFAGAQRSACPHLGLCALR